MIEQKYSVQNVINIFVKTSYRFHQHPKRVHHSATTTSDAETNTDSSKTSVDCSQPPRDYHDSSDVD